MTLIPPVETILINKGNFWNEIQVSSVRLKTFLPMYYVEMLQIASRLMVYAICMLCSLQFHFLFQVLDNIFACERIVSQSSRAETVEWAFIILIKTQRNERREAEVGIIAIIPFCYLFRSEKCYKLYLRFEA